MIPALFFGWAACQHRTFVEGGPLPAPPCPILPADTAPNVLPTDLEGHLSYDIEGKLTPRWHEGPDHAMEVHQVALAHGAPRAVTFLPRAIMPQYCLDGPGTILTVDLHRWGTVDGWPFHEVLRNVVVHATPDRMLVATLEEEWKRADPAIGLALGEEVVEVPTEEGLQLKGTLIPPFQWTAATPRLGRVPTSSFLWFDLVVETDDPRWTLPPKPSLDDRP